jgi:hypothetical protein
MKKNNPVIISVLNPCHESWVDMSPVEKGRFCQSCQKHVLDFSEMDDQQLISAISKIKGPVCGRYRSDQLDRRIVNTVNSGQSFFPGVILSTLLAAIVPSVKANQVTPQMELSENKSNSLLKDTTGAYIEGKVTDREATTAAVIQLKGTACQTTADSSGYFRLILPPGPILNGITLVINTGFEPMEITPHVDSLGNYSFVRLDLPKKRFSVGPQMGLTTFDIEPDPRTKLNHKIKSTIHKSH